MESPTRLYLLRHAEVEERYHRVFGGRIDMDLSPFGREQAAALAKYLERVPFHAIFASPMKRAQQTLTRLVQLQNKQPTVVPELREVDFGVWTGLSWEEVREQFGVSAFEWLDQLDKGAIREAEAVTSFRERVQLVLARILDECPGQTVAVVCHGGVLRMLLSLLLDLPLRKTAGFDFSYASLSVVDWLPRKVEVQLLNFTPWRDLA